MESQLKMALEAAIVGDHGNLITRKLIPTHRRRHDNDFQRFLSACAESLDILQYTKENVGLECSLMRLIEHNNGIFPTERNNFDKLRQRKIGITYTILNGVFFQKL